MVRSTFIIFVSAIIFLHTFQILAKPKKIILWEHIWDQSPLIKIILDRTVDKYGPYKLEKSINMEQGRAVKSLVDNDLINIIILPASLERESTLLPVYIYAGGASLGYRVCLIKKGNQYKYNKIKNLSDWNRSGLIMGTGTHWADTPVLEHNSIKLVKNPKYEGLYYMLAAERFDCFPRGICQITRKLNQFGPKGKGLPLEIEKRLLFVYPFRTIFFVSKKEPELKERLLYGYNKALKEKIWGKNLDNYALCRKDEYDVLKLKKRVIIWLENPFISENVKNIKIYDYDPLK